MTFVLMYQGVESQRREAEAKLRRTLRGVTLTPKSTTTLEAELEPEQVRQVAVDENWRVTRSVYADINPPKVNLSTLRQKLAADKPPSKPSE